MSSADLIVERGAQRLHQLAGRAAAHGGGIGAWLAEELEADAGFLRKLKPSLIAARVRAATNGAATAEEPPPPPQAATQPQKAANPEPPPALANPEPPPAASGPEPPAAPPKRNPKPSGGPSPWLFVGAALVVGIVAARVLDWRSHAD